MYLIKSIIVVASLVACAASTSPNLGCKNCLGLSADLINHDCSQKCNEAFNPSSSENEKCYELCHHFAFERHCCSGTCSSDANTCMNQFLPPDKHKRSLLSSIYERREHVRDLIPVVEYDGAVSVRDDETGLIEARVDRGKACCKVAQAILASSVIKVIPYLQEQVWNEDTLAGVVLVAFGLASSGACNYLYQVSCRFVAQGVDGNVANGPLPAQHAGL
ncbi:hypothetical protein F4819DRAFT_499732 [Hypoxylon fuscum]|nr:hypothetical protein F4819DRAFT_499732 [Hypoxylon fuscum]